MNFASEIAAYDHLAYVGRWESAFGLVTYRTLGEGPPFCLIPGIASTYRGYAPLLNILARSFHTVVFDYPGEHLDDESNLCEITHDDLTSQVLGLLDSLSIDRCALFGPSFGSTILLKCIIREPLRFPKSVIQGGFVRRHLGRLERAALAFSRRVPGSLSNLPLRETLLASKNKRHFGDPISDRWPIYVEQNGLTPIAALSHRLDLVSRLDLRDSLRTVQARVLAIQGEEDRVITRAEWDELCGSFAGIEGKLFLGVGHQPHFTDPERLAEIMTDWLV